MSGNSPNYRVATSQNFQASKSEWKFDSWPAIITSFLIWATSYQIVRYLLSKKSPEYCIRIIGFVHGLICAFVGINECFVTESPFDHPEWYTTASQKFLFVFSLGYFMHDFGWLLRYDRTSKLMLTHHISSNIALYRMLMKDVSGAEGTCSLGIMEITNPLLQSRWFLRSEGYYPSVVFTSVEITFFIIFLVIRFIFGTYLMFVITFQPKNDWDLIFLTLIMYVMSWVFMVNIVKYFITKYFLPRENHPAEQKEA